MNEELRCGCTTEIPIHIKSFTIILFIYSILKAEIYMVCCFMQDSSKPKKHQYLVQLDVVLTHWRTKMGLKSKDVRELFSSSTLVKPLCKQFLLADCF